MHALLITFTSNADPKELQAVAIDYAKALRGVDGVVSKTWLADGDTQGGFYLFADKAAAQSFRSGPMVGALRSHPAFRDLTIREFAVSTELSALTGVVAKNSGQW